jgi:uncharacterized cupredoxin-like copper-binding protein
MRRKSFFGLLSVIGVVVFVGALVTSGPREVDAQEEGAIEATVGAVVNAWNARDVGNFVSFWTEQGFEAEFGFSKSDLQQLAAMIGEPPIVDYTVENIVITDGTATADVMLSFGVFSQSEEWTFVLNGAKWQIDDTEAIAPEIPAGANVVDVQLDEYQFIYDPAQLADGGEVAFSIENVGEQNHEFVLLELTTDTPLSELLQSEEDEPEGLEFIAATEAGPGESTAVVVPDLEPGHYALVCFLPSPDGTPHAFLGMTSEFNVGSGSGASTGSGTEITPPNTGDGGLKASVTSANTSLLLASVLLTTVGLLGALPLRR